MDDEKSVWSMLGRSAGLLGETGDREGLEKRIEELEDLLALVQSEMLGSIEALQRRITFIEESKVSQSVLDVMPVEELNELVGTSIGEWPEGDEVKQDTVTVVQSGLTYNAPEEGDELPEDEEHPDLLEDAGHALDKWQQSAELIYLFIHNHGGVANADWKRRGLTPDDFVAEDRKKVDKILRQDRGIVKWNKNNMWHFYYKDGDDRDVALERAYGPRD